MKNIHLSPIMLQIGNAMIKNELSISNRINECLLRFAMTPADLARELKVKRQSVDAWVKGRAEPSKRNCEKMAKLFSVSVEWLIYGSIKASEIDQELLTLVISEVERAQNDIGINLTVEQKAEVAADIYAYFSPSKSSMASSFADVVRALIRQFVKRK